MNGSFSTQITQLRKQKGISQKQAAADLGISQSLLSHYEKGIRECGNSFVVKVSRYYNVSCDYLLGRTSESRSVPSVSELDEMTGDSEYSLETAFHAYQILLERVRSVDEAYYNKLNTFLALNIYRGIIASAQAGCIPSNWCADTDNEVFFGMTLAALADSFLGGVKRGEPMQGDPTPKSVETVEMKCNDYLRSYLEKVSDL